MKRFLVIKHGAFGDLIHATGAFAALRSNNPDAHITLLTDPAFQSLTSLMPYFDAFYYDARARTLASWLRLRNFLRQGSFDFIYDFQATSRSNFYHKLFWPSKAPDWSGCAKGCSHYQGPPYFDTVHVQDRLKTQLVATDVILQTQEISPQIDWLASPLDPLPLRKPFILMVPGCSKAHPQKRWPQDFYKDLALRFVDAGFHVGLIGGPDEKDILANLASTHPYIHDLGGKLTFPEIATLARQGALAVGNDTGPMHLIAATGIKTFYLWSGASQPQVFAPRGSHVTILFETNLETLEPSNVWKQIYP